MDDEHLADRPGWIALDDVTRSQYWDRFYDMFDFTPGVAPSNWPAIREPTPSLTFDLAAITDGPSRAAAYDSINSEAIRCFVFTRTDSPLVVLDWQHTAWSYSPSIDVGNAEPDDPIDGHPTVYPNGDYYSFLTPDFAEGTFGHPWEQTLCVMGDRLVETLGASLATWLPVKRRNGIPTGE